MKLSVVVPVYNVENYLEECVNSIINQTYKNIEVILVDDGSTDNSGKICDKFKKQDKRIKVIHQKNSGPSVARNNGIKNSSGDYITFVDSDDFYSSYNELEKLMNELNGYIDVLQFNMCYYYEKSKKILKLNRLENLKTCSSIEVIKKLIESNQLSVSPCDKIIKAKFLKDNSIYFEEGIFCEDIDWSLKLYLYVNYYKVVDIYSYTYRQQRKGSTTSSKNLRRTGDMFYVIKKWYKFDYKNDEIKNLYYNYLAYQYTIVRTISKNSYFNKEDKELIKKLDKEIFKYDLSYKVKLVNKFRKVFGIKITIFIMRVYLFMKNIGLMKI